MITEQTLRSEVLDYLRTNYSIRLDIPAYRRHYSDTISLRLFKSPMGEGRMENRYLLLIKQSEDLLKKNIVNTDKIKEFGQNFFEIITQDILVLQGNQDIRKGFAKMRDHISYRVEELGTEQKAIEEECKAINTKQQILTFLEGSFRTYLGQVRQVSEQYQSVNNVQVLTSINIDSLYSERLGNEEDYTQHYQPLLQVMQRLKSNMIKLYKQLNGCQYYELPLRSVNFLANCKNLLLQLEPFLIRPDCVFNRLIFHVVRGQKENNRLIGRVFHANSVFANDVISDIFKAVFLSHMFQDRSRAHKARIEQERDQLVRAFENPNVNNDNFYNIVIKIEKGINQIRGELQQLKNVIGMGKDKIMRAYLGRKQCKRIIQISQLETSCLDVTKFSRHMHEVLKYRAKIQIVKQKYIQNDKIANKTIRTIKELEEANSRPSKANISELNQIAEQQFVSSYTLIQQGFLQLQTIKQKLKDIKDEIVEPYFQEQYFPKLEEDLNDLSGRYRGTESEMLNSYQSLRKQKLAKAGQAREEIRKGLQDFSDYFEAKVIAQAGHEIRNEDSQCQEVKDYIIKIEKLQFLLHNYLSLQGKDELEEVQQYKTNFQCLLQVYEGSMDQRIFESFVEKLNFEADDWTRRVAKVRQLTRQLTRYVTTLKKILSSSNAAGTKLFPKVSKLIKNRTQLYQILQDMYEEFIQIYETCKKGQANNPTDQGLKLFDQASYKYVLMLYQYRNRTRAEVQELKDLLLPQRTLNYLLDDIFEPFLHIFKIYASYTEQQLLTFTLRLEHALNFKGSHIQIIQLYEQTLAKAYTPDFFQNVAKISEEIVQLGSQNKKVLQLQQQEVMIYNLKEFKQLAQVISQHVSFAEALLRGLKAKDLRMEVQLSNKTLMILRDKIVGDWQEHKSDLRRSGVIDQFGADARD